MRIKICGLTSIEDAVACVSAGADAIGINLVPSSARRVTEETAIAIARAVGERAKVVLVVAGLDLEGLRPLPRRIGATCLQLHGDEPPSLVSALLPHAYKAVRVAGTADVTLAERSPGDLVLVDAKVDGALGGTGIAFDWRLLGSLSTRRKMVLAGGLTPDNVADAVRLVRPYAVDVASGVEPPGNPRKKDLARVREFIARARSVPALAARP